jgi:peptidoglycan hydrolase CwlO-like protein
MKIKQITSLSLVLVMLELSTSCGKSTAVNSSLPTHQTQAANLNQNLLLKEQQKETWIEWGKRHWIGITATVLYIAFTEYRIHGIKADATKSKTAANNNFKDIADTFYKEDNKILELENKVNHNEQRIEIHQQVIERIEKVDKPDL